MRLLLLFVLAISGFVHGNPANIENYWLQSAPPNAMMMAAYGEIVNHTKNDMVLIGAYSPAFKMAEIHKTIIEDGIAKMIPQPSLRIKPNSTLIFKPGSYHIMLMHPIVKFTQDDSIKINLIYQQGDKKIIQETWFPVEFR